MVSKANLLPSKTSETPPRREPVMLWDRAAYLGEERVHLCTSGLQCLQEKLLSGCKLSYS